MEKKGPDQNNLSNETNDGFVSLGSMIRDKIIPELLANMNGQSPVTGDNSDDTKGLKASLREVLIVPESEDEPSNIVSVARRRLLRNKLRRRIRRTD